MAFWYSSSNICMAVAKQPQSSFTLLHQNRGKSIQLYGTKEIEGVRQTVGVKRDLIIPI